jgi:3-dehydroquinate synthase
MLSGHSARESAIVVVGGGSVGDWAGFLASVLKRGIAFVNIPSTWLAAIDSAHGGKTALNVDAYKNQVGTFYPATAIYCVKEILDQQPQENVRSGYGEALKMAILAGGPLYKKFIGCKDFNSDFLWKVLPQLVMAKYQVVKRDPFEKLGIRQILNLGHTMGHAIELEQKLPHGLAVQLGLEFSLEWSFREGLIKARDYEVMKSLLVKNRVPPLARLSAERLRLCIQQDKKTHNGDEVGFVFIKSPGKPVYKNVKMDELIQVARDSGWVQ